MRRMGGRLVGVMMTLTLPVPSKDLAAATHHLEGQVLASLKRAHLPRRSLPIGAMTSDGVALGLNNLSEGCVYCVCIFRSAVYLLF